nr:recombinase family protein [Streptococcus equi]
MLNKENTITPAERKMQISNARYQNHVILTDSQKRNVWSANSIRQIIRNEAYKGTYLYNTRTYINVKHVRRPESEWERIENNHEAIISVEDFEETETIRTSKVTNNKNQTVYRTISALKGMIQCEHCNHSLSSSSTRQGYRYYSCRYCKVQGYEVKSCREDKIEEAIIKKLDRQQEELCSKVSQKQLFKEIENLKSRKFSIFQDYKDERITREEFLTQKHEIDNSIDTLQKNIEESDESQLVIGHTLNKDVVEKYIERVIVDYQGAFEIIYK